MNVNCFVYFHSCEIITSSNTPDSAAKKNASIIGKLEFSFDSECERISSIDDYFSSSSSSISDEDELSAFEPVFSRKLVRNKNTSEDGENEDSLENDAFRKGSNEECSGNNSSEEEVSVKCFYGTIHVRNVFCIQCDGCGKWWNSTRSCVKIKKGTSLLKFQ